jgi:uncharacterized protein (TIGR02246 family)
MKMWVGCLCAVVVSLPAFAEDTAAPAAPDMTKIGPMSRKVTKEDKKGVDALYAAMDGSMKKADVNALADLMDFPVMMVTDDSSGAESHAEMNRDQFVKMMTPFMHEPPKGMTSTHKHSPRFLSDTLAMVDEDTSMTMGKAKGAWKSESMVVQKDGKWKVKAMFEAGWGDMSKAGQAAAAPAAPAAAPTPGQKTAGAK